MGRDDLLGILPDVLNGEMQMQMEGDTLRRE